MLVALLCNNFTLTVISTDRADCADVLLANGAKPDANDCHFGTPLHVAARRGYYQCVEVLLRHGTNVNVSKN